MLQMSTESLESEIDSEEDLGERSTIDSHIDSHIRRLSYEISFVHCLDTGNMTFHPTCCSTVTFRMSYSVRVVHGKWSREFECVSGLGSA